MQREICNTVGREKFTTWFLAEGLGQGQDKSTFGAFFLSRTLFKPNLCQVYCDFTYMLKTI